MGIVIIMVGLPASGKTTTRNKIAGATIVCPDDHIGYTKENPWDFQAARQAWKIANKELEEALTNGDELVVFDATMLTPKKRRKYIELAKQNDYKPIAIYCEASEEVCRQRNATRTTYRQVPDETIADMAGRLVPPELEEGFVAVIRVSEDKITKTGKLNQLEELCFGKKKSAI